MRIRKRSVAVFSKERTCTSNSTGRGGDEEEEKAKKDFLFPLLVAVMDAQAKAEAEVSESKAPQPKPAPDFSEAGARGRKIKNWRNALLRLEEKSEFFKIGEEDDKFDCRRDGIMRNAGDEFEPLTNKGHDRKLELPKSDLFEKTCKSKEEEDLGLYKIKRKIMDRPTKCDSIRHITAARRDYSDAKCSQTVSKNDYPKRKSKAFSDEDDDNSHGGSRCRRRNGRGWRCSQRTLVGYSLCEHHLGKSRFKSINSSKGLVPATSKGSKFKKLHLIM